MIAFKNLKKVTLDIQDKIPSGKLAGCRVCDVIEDHYEYLIWCNKNGMLHFSKPVITKIHQLAAYAENEEFFDNEIAPYLEQALAQNGIFDDVPY